MLRNIKDNANRYDILPKIGRLVCIGLEPW